MKIMHINLNFNQSSLYEQLSNHLLKHGCNHTVFYPCIKGKEIKNPPSYLIQPSILNKFDRLFFSRRNKKIINYMSSNMDLMNYSLNHAHSLFSNGMIAYTLKKKYGTPYIVAVRDTDINVFFKKMKHLKNKGINILKEADKIIFLSKPYKDYLLNKIVSKKIKKKLEKKIEIIPNGINPYWLENINEISHHKHFLNNSKNKIKVLSVGFINKRKNQLATAKACEILQKKCIDVEFTIVGDIKDKSYFNKLRQFNFIKYIPHVDKNELKNIYRSSDVYVMPSTTETFGLVYAEAMTQGLPVLYSRGQGFDEQFEEGTVGYSVDKKSPSDIANKILCTLNNKEKINNKKLSKLEMFSWKNISASYIKIYNETLSSHKF